jgi:enoyl-CoA hydratase/carnithine racemase
VITTESDTPGPRPVRELVLDSPILSVSALTQLRGSLHALAGRPGPLVIRSTHASIFLAGAHLNEIEALDASTARDYALLGRLVLGEVRGFHGPVVAAVQGACAGGGLDLVLACDAVVASESASFTHPGVRRGLVTGWGGTIDVPRRAGEPQAGSIFLEGGTIAAPVAAAAGWVARVSPDPVSAAHAEALRLHLLNPRRLQLWRQLKDARFIDIFHASVVHNGRTQQAPNDRETP